MRSTRLVLHLHEPFFFRPQKHNRGGGTAHEAQNLVETGISEMGLEPGEGDKAEEAQEDVAADPHASGIGHSRELSEGDIAAGVAMMNFDADPTDSVFEETNWPEPEFTLAEAMVKGVSNMVLDVFFSRVEIVNDENIPHEGPCILFANHMNQFVDGSIVLRAAGRPVSFVTAESSMHKPIIGTLARLAGSVPVVRPQDLAKVGPGCIVEIKLTERLINGECTEFFAVPKGHAITISGVGQFFIEETISNTQARFKPLPPGEEVALDKLVKSKYKITPKVSHSEMFEEVFNKLEDGGCIGIFPEGGSHDRTELLPLKVGIAIMALGARARGIPVKLLPIGINYFAAHVFRSKVFVDVGQPIIICGELVEMFQTEEGKREACARLLADIQQALDFTCLTAPDFDTLKVIRTARRMYQSKVQLSPKEYIELNLRFSQAYRVWHGLPEFQQLMQDIREYLDFARSLDLKDKQVRDLPPLGSVHTLINAVKDVLLTFTLVLVVFPMILPGILLNLPLAYEIKLKLPRHQRQALAKSNVKVAARDVVASQEIMMAMKLVPLLHVIYSLMWMIFLYMSWPFYHEWFGEWGQVFVHNAFWFLPLCFLFLGPYYSFSVCPRLGEVLARRVRLLPKYLLCIRAFFSLSKRQPAELLRVERKKLSIRVQDLAEKLLAEENSSIPGWASDRIINRRKIMKNRSRSVRQIAKGDLTFSRSALPDEMSEEQRKFARLSFD